MPCASPTANRTLRCYCKASYRGLLHQCHRTDHDPFVSATPCGRSTPAIHCTSNGAFGCFFRYQSGNLPRIFTSGLAGASVNFSQQSCSVCL